MSRRGIFRGRSTAAASAGGNHKSQNHVPNSNSSVISADDYSESSLQTDGLHEDAASSDSIIQTTQEQQATARFSRRSSLDLMGGGGGGGVRRAQRAPPSPPPPPKQVKEKDQNKPGRTRSFGMFQRRGSVGTGTTASSASATTSSSLKPQAQQQPPPKGRMFRRASLDAVTTSSSTAAAADTAAALTSFFPSFQRQQQQQDSAAAAPPPPPANLSKPFRRGSFGPRGDAQPPRPVTRRASIGDQQQQHHQQQQQKQQKDPQDDNHTDDNCTVPRRGVISGSGAGFDFHRDSTRKIILTEAPTRRVTRRSSVGPGIQGGTTAVNVNPTTTTTASSLQSNSTTITTQPPPFSAQGQPQQQQQQQQEGSKPKKKGWKNPFRRQAGADKKSAKPASSSRQGRTDSGGGGGGSSSSNGSIGGGGGGGAADGDMWESFNYETDSMADRSTGCTTPREINVVATGDDDDPPSPVTIANNPWRPRQDDILEDEELMTQSPSLMLPYKEPTVKFAPEPQIHVFDFRKKATDGSDSDDDNDTVTDYEDDVPADEMSPEALHKLKSKLWWNSEEMAGIRQECMELVRDYVDDSEYMDAVTKLFSSHKKSVTQEHVRNALEKVAQRSVVRGLEMHICPRGGLLCEKHRRIVLTNVASTTVDGLANTGEGWLLIRKESMKASRPCRQYALKMAEHDAMEAMEATVNPSDANSNNGNSDDENDATKTKDAAEESNEEYDEHENNIKAKDDEHLPSDKKTAKKDTGAQEDRTPTPKKKSSRKKSSASSCSSNSSVTSGGTDKKKKKRSKSSVGSESCTIKNSSKSSSKKQDAAPKAPLKEPWQEFNPNNILDDDADGAAAEQCQPSGEGSSQDGMVRTAA